MDRLLRTSSWLLLSTLTLSSRQSAAKCHSQSLDDEFVLLLFFIVLGREPRDLPAILVQESRCEKVSLCPMWVIYMCLQLTASRGKPEHSVNWFLKTQLRHTLSQLLLLFYTEAHCCPARRNNNRAQCSVITWSFHVFQNGQSHSQLLLESKWGSSTLTVFQPKPLSLCFGCTGARAAAGAVSAVALHSGATVMIRGCRSWQRKPCRRRCFSVIRPDSITMWNQKKNQTCHLPLGFSQADYYQTEMVALFYFGYFASHILRI